MPLNFPALHPKDPAPTDEFELPIEMKSLCGPVLMLEQAPWGPKYVIVRYADFSRGMVFEIDALMSGLHRFERAVQHKAKPKKGKK